jgi:hypothetical protein
MRWSRLDIPQIGIGVSFVPAILLISAEALSTQPAAMF